LMKLTPGVTDIFPLFSTLSVYFFSNGLTVKNIKPISVQNLQNCSFLSYIRSKET